MLAGAPLYRSQFHNQFSHTYTETACMYSRFYFLKSEISQQRKKQMKALHKHIKESSISEGRLLSAVLELKIVYWF